MVSLGVIVGEYLQGMVKGRDGGEFLKGEFVRDAEDESPEEWNNEEESVRDAVEESNKVETVRDAGEESPEDWNGEESVRDAVGEKNQGESARNAELVHNTRC